jgi:hypothetical protein
MKHSYKGYVIDEDLKTISYNGEVLEDDSLYYYSEAWDDEGFYLFDKDGNEFNPDFGHITAEPTPEDLEEYKKRLETQKAVEASIENQEWVKKVHVENTQMPEGIVTEKFHYWKHPVYGEINWPELKLPSKFKADSWLNDQLRGRKTEMILKAWFEAWVDLRFS